MASVILDTNIFVAAGFNSRSHSARIINLIKTNQLTLVWDQSTQRETKKIITQIPPLSWSQVSPLFKSAHQHLDQLDRQAYQFIPDPDDRKFAALAQATGATLITNDDHLLAHRHHLTCPVMTPAEFFTQTKPTSSSS